MLPTVSATTPRAWKLRRAVRSDEERFFVLFLHSQRRDPTAHAWTCDGVARTEDDARTYASQFGISPASFTDALNRSRNHAAALQAEACEMVADDAVAFARGGFQALSLDDADSPVAARDQPLTLQRPKHHRDRRAMHAQHHREKFLFE
jgi:hypothetical protein